MKLPPDMRASITNTANANGYPITGFTWLIVRQQSPKAAQLKRFLHWATTTGQQFTKPLAYAALPAAVRQRESKMIDAVK